MRTKIGSSLVLVLLAGTACSKDTQGLGTPDAGAVAETPDATAAAPDATVAAAPDAEVPDLGPPPRVLVERKLFGEMPLDNLVVDPLFDLTAGHWFAVVGADTAAPQVGTMSKRDFGLTPAGLPVAEVPKGMSNPSNVVAVGPVMSFEAPAVASVWIGRLPDDRALTASVSASIVATMPNGQSRTFALAPEEDRTEELDGIVWQRFAATIETSPAGISSFYVGDDTPAGFFITAPTVVAMQAELRGSTTLPKRALERPLTARERNATKLAAKKRRERL